MRVLLILPLLACASNSDPVCGDGHCDAEENATSCASDCAIACVEQTDCLASLACVDSFCQDVTNRQATFEAYLMVVPNTTPTGEQWDEFDGADAFVVVSSNGIVVLRTESIENVTQVEVFEHTEEARLNLDATIETQIFDDDVSSATEIARCATTMTIEMVREGGYTCVDGPSQVSIGIRL